MKLPFREAGMKQLVVFPTLLAFWAAAAGAAPPRIACTLPALTALAREIGGDAFEYVTLARPDQDPHFVSPVPSLMRKLHGADVLFEIGMQLELWADQVANGSGNPRIFRGGPGRFQVSLGIPVEEVPSVLTRAEGDLHPQGNPHLWLDPLRARRIAANMADALARVFPEQAASVRGRFSDFSQRLYSALFGAELVDLVGAEKLTRLAFDGELWGFLERTELDGRSLIERAGGWLARARPLRGVPVLEFHKVWVYFCRTFGCELAGTIEEKPGIPPGPQHLRRLATTIRQRGVRLILVDNYYDPRLPRRIAEDTGVRVVVLPNQPGGEPGTETYFALIDHILDRILEALSGTGP